MFSFKSRENTMILSLRCRKLKGLGELIRTLNVLRGEVHLDTKRVGSARFPTCLRHLLL